MKLTKEQARAVFNLFEKQLNADGNKKRKLIQIENKRIEAEAVEKFKLTLEYLALLLLNKSFPHHQEFKCAKDKYFLELLSLKFFNIKLKSDYVFFHSHHDTINLLSIDCKNLEQLKAALSKHWGIKIKNNGI